MKNIALKILLSGVIALAAAGCAGEQQAFSKFPGTKDGARALLGEFLKPGADLKKLTMELRPTREDYRAFYTDERMAERAEVFFDKLWSSGDAVVAPKDGQTELKLFSATPKEMVDDVGESSSFPPGMLALAGDLKQDLPIYAFKFVKPGEDIGMAFEGLTHINGRWRLFPKPWRFMEAK